MTDLAPLDLAGLTPPETPPDETPAPQLAWIDIALLRVDRSYQREIERTGRLNIRRIAAKFDWRKFAPVVVAPVAGGLYAVIDGQHRAHAALLVGHDKVPCAIVQADRRMQAAAFAAINGNVTRMSALSVFRAAVGAGVPEAVELRDLAQSCGVRILGYPVAVAQMKNGDTTAPKALQDCFRRFGAVTLRKALLAIMAPDDSGAPTRDARGLVNPAIVRGLCLTFSRLPFALATENVARVFRHLDLAKARHDADKWGDELHEVILKRLSAIARQGAAPAAATEGAADA